jgi:hypothetical protein
MGDSIDALLEQLLADPDAIGNMDEDSVNAARASLNPYGQSIKVEGSKSEVVAYSLLNLKEDYIIKLVMTSLIGFLHRSGDEWRVPDGDYVTPTEELDRTAILRELIEDNTEDGEIRIRPERQAGVSGGENFSQEETAENKFRRLAVREFFEEMFNYNSDIHVRSAFAANRADPERDNADDIEKRVVRNAKRSRDTRRNTRKGKTIKKVRAKDGKPDNSEERRRLPQDPYNVVVNNVPPAEIYRRFRYYYEANYDALRAATRDLYAAKPDMDHTLIVYGTFPDKDAYDKFVSQNDSSVSAGIRCAPKGQWTFQCAFRENAKRTEYFNSDVRILKEMLDRAEADDVGADRVVGARVRRACRTAHHGERVGRDGGDEHDLVTDTDRVASSERDATTGRDDQ